MAKAEAKTKPTAASVADFIASIPEARKRQDAEALLALMTEATGEAPVMWGPAIVGFGAYHYEYGSGHEGDAPAAGFSPRKQALTIYIMPGFDPPGYRALLDELGPHSLGKSCLYIKRLADIRLPVLQALVAKSYRDVKAMYPSPGGGSPRAKRRT